MTAEAASVLAAEGFYVFPCQPNGKPPALTGWQQASTREPSAINALWDTCGYNCNVGIDCGKSGIAVIDLDDKNGRAGSSTWAVLQMIHGDVPITRTHRTPSGGRHLLFRQPGDITNSPLDRNGIDIRGAGGLIVGPGSFIDGKAYTLERHIEMASFPEWPRLLLQARRHERREAPDDLDLDTEWAQDQARQEIARWVSKGWVPVIGNRNNSVQQMAARLHGLGISEDLAVELIDDHYLPHGIAPDEATAFIVRSAYDRPQNPAGSELRLPGSIVHAGLPIVAQVAEEQRANKLWRLRDMAHAPRITYWDQDNLLPRLRSGVGIWFGPSGEHKTNVIISKIFELLVQTTMNVLYLCGEGFEGIGPRFTAQCLARGIDPALSDINDRFAAHFVPMMGDIADVEHCIDRLAHENFTPDIVFIDTMATALVGFDEDNRTAGQLTRNGAVGKFAAKLGALVILIGHTGKDASLGLRGAQGFYDSCDVVIAHRADREDDGRGVILSTYKKDGGKQKDGRKNKVWYALDTFNDMIIPRRCTRREYERLTEKSKYDFTVEDINEALFGILGQENGVTSKVVVMKMWPNDHGEDAKAIDEFWDRQAARLEKQAARHHGFNNSLLRNGPLLWYLGR